MPASAQPETETAQQRDHSAGKRIASFLAGAATGLATHEAGHVVMNLALGEKPGIRKVDFHGVRFSRSRIRRAPAVLDAWRYFHPGSRWAAWTSRGVKIGMAVMIAR